MNPPLHDEIDNMIRDKVKRPAVVFIKMDQEFSFEDSSNAITPKLFVRITKNQKTRIYFQK